MTYRIKDWDRIFENSESRKLKNLNWVPMPNSWDGRGYIKVTKHKQAVSILAAWPLIVQIGSKCPHRGLLAKVDGPLSAEDMADLTRMPVEVFARALDALTSPEIGWIEEIPCKSEILSVLGESPDASGELPGISRNVGPEGKGTEGNNIVAADADPDIPEALKNQTGFADEWSHFLKHRKSLRKPMTARAKQILLRRLAERPSQAIHAIQTAMVRGWQSIEWDWIDKTPHALPHAEESPRPKIDEAAFREWVVSQYPNAAKHNQSPTTCSKSLIPEFLEATQAQAA